MTRTDERHKISATAGDWLEVNETPGGTLSEFEPEAE